MIRSITWAMTASNGLFFGINRLYGLYSLGVIRINITFCNNSYYANFNGILTIGYSYQLCVCYQQSGQYNDYMYSTITGTMTINFSNGTISNYSNSNGSGISSYHVSIGDQWIGKTKDFKITYANWTLL